QDAYNILYQILDNKNWKVRYYSQEPQTAVVLIAPLTTDSNKLEA
ncbi:29788_t:CDS:1, partial [Racocetra persica]